MIPAQSVGHTLIVNAERLRRCVERHRFTLTLAWVAAWSTLVAAVTVITCR